MLVVSGRETHCSDWSNSLYLMTYQAKGWGLRAGGRDTVYHVLRVPFVPLTMSALSYWLCCSFCSDPTFSHYKTESHQGRKNMFNLMTHSTHFIYGYMASDIW